MPLRDAEKKEGPNLYAYVGNNPVNLIDPLGLHVDSCCKEERERIQMWRDMLGEKAKQANEMCALANRETPEIAFEVCLEEAGKLVRNLLRIQNFIKEAGRDYLQCMKDSGCSLKPPPCPIVAIGWGGPQGVATGAFNQAKKDWNDLVNGD